MPWSYLLLAIFALLVFTNSIACEIGLIPLHDHPRQVEQPYGHDISLHGTPDQAENPGKWVVRIADVPIGLETLAGIQNPGHKLFIYYSKNSMVSSGQTSAPMSQKLINGNLPGGGNHLV